MPSRDTKPCPAPEELEVAVTGSNPDPAIVEHIRTCSRCGEQAETIRVNDSFMRSVRRRLGPDLAIAPPAETQPHLVPGYEIVREIARGGQGIVVEALQEGTRRRVAIKLLRPLEQSPRARRRLEREGEIAAGLRHPGIVTIYESRALPDGRFAVAMEFIEGVELDEWIRSLDTTKEAPPAKKRAALRRVLTIFAQVCDAVQHAHHHGVIHRDLKPSNILVDATDQPHVLDFGIARRKRRADDPPSLTHTGEFAGTLAYASPEQVSGDPDRVDARADVYALGVILYEVLTDRPPYPGQTSLREIVEHILNTSPSRLGVLRWGQSAGVELEAIVMRALAKDPTRRYQSAAALRSDLESYLAGRPIEARRDSAWYIVRKTAAQHRAATATVIGGVVVLAAFAGAMAWSADRLAKQRAQLAETLAISEVDRGRLLARGGNLPQGERLIWPRLISGGTDLRDPGLGLTSPPTTMRAFWALAELYAGQGCLASARTNVRSGTLVYSRDGSELLIVGMNGDSERLSATDGELLGASPPFTTGSFLSHKPSTDGRFLAVMDGATLRLLDLRERIAVGEVSSSSGEYRHASFSPDGSRLVTVSERGEVLLWDTSSLTKIASCPRLSSPECAPRLSRSGDLVLIADAAGGASLWTHSTGEVTTLGAEPTGSASLPAQVLALSLEGDAVAARTTNPIHLSTWKTKPTRSGPELTGPAGPIGAAEFSADGQRLIASSYDKAQRVWSVWGEEPGRLLRTLRGHEGVTARVALDREGLTAATMDADRLVRVWSVEPTGATRCIRLSGAAPRSLAFASDSSMLAVGRDDGIVQLLSMPDGRTIRSWVADMSPTGSVVSSVTFSPDGLRLLTTGRGGEVSLWDTRSGSRTALLHRAEAWTSCARFSPDGTLVASADESGKVACFDVSTGSRLFEVQPHAHRIPKLAFDLAGRVIVSVGGDGTCIVTDARTGDVLRSLPGHKGVLRALTFAQDGSLLTAGDDRSIRVWNVQTGELRAAFSGVTHDLFALAAHPAGRLIFSCGRDEAVEVWDAATCRPIAALPGHSGLVFDIALSRDGDLLATAGADRNVLVWSLTDLRNRVIRNAAAAAITPSDSFGIHTLEK